MSGDDVERAAQTVYEAMCWAVRNLPISRDVPDWPPGGNSYAQEIARQAARAAERAALAQASTRDVEISDGIMERVSAEIVRDIIDDLADRRGLRQAWDQIDNEIAAEIHDDWAGYALTRIRALAKPRESDNG